MTRNHANPIHAARNRNRLIMASIAVVALIVIGVGVTWMSQRGDSETPEGLVYVIPEGASKTVDAPAIDSVMAIPTEIVFEPGEVSTITIINNDSVANRAGPWVVGPGQSYTLELENPGTYQFDCAVDPRESVTITVMEPED